ncbi:MAG: hypothetical protein A3J07_03225 [Candidatus Doudnabacteria bacterium RIFCSPLOWO2_02_FULL_49_13]|uniref:D-alanine--D-alanine ligase n=1 Tax=Candidatus Doudnabacteria bacterium RIFCSPHIGHO2_12_FULL_48_16 TaxID=1817838 RepID=A0A1F5PIB9_9BACT|nr:MAG: hypothetical protein A3B77_02030 [Candidatus Doudnabacteria bacterium RIFCSPHIGHO2_02_FULL_49_24]OGE89021.1 MAG: hypothetical protein A2760_00150 [Candidatus Doudnabacteria bacterium RIFCSPHIGHO2_01_FULL_50_67]OGE89688.1 MAG: hypothetical protein A3E29_00525 [Candidatus Doudnabacteria bacterium RIFCSPHIGHO2_12_FULL_48_16]OGE97522.1 MAG: hypothetical protein A2990_02265 [Candidatus Doudnabacteria bacterium RIFCSPLOWO2_01_FULL_49_40]OGF03074.1 MAG: hypothetical protein A3J07_03225 [Candid
MSRKLRVALFFGGTSREREVSLLSGKVVAEHLDKNKYEVVPVEIALDGQWLTSSETIKQIVDKAGAKPVADNKEIVPVEKNPQSGIDVAFLALHGPGGEDGSVQGMLDVLKIPYTFSGVQASALAMDKNKTKRLVATEGIKVPVQIMIVKSEYEKNPNSFLHQISGKVVIKPNRIGSSFGVTITDNQQEIKKALDLAFEHDSEVLVEEYISGIELTVPILGNNKLQALPVIEIVPKNGSTFFDFKAKYDEQYRDEIVPARIKEELAKKLQELALRIHKLLGCRGITRSDFIVTPAGEIYFLEVNTIPGLTNASLVPQAAVAIGMSYSQFLDRLIQLALDKE